MIAIFVILLLAVSQFSANIYTPSMPVMTELLHASTAQIQFSLSIYYLAFGFSQFIYGPLSDSYGRKKLLLFGLGIYLLGTFLIIFHPTILMLLVGRCIQGLGIGSGMVVGRSILCDVYQGNKLRKISNLLSIVVVFVPMISPLCGAFFQRYFSWVATFVFLFVMCAFVLLVIATMLPETNQQQTKQIQPLRVIKAYWQAMTRIEFMRYALSGGIVFSIVAVMYVSFPFLFTHLLGPDPFVLSMALVFGIFSCIVGSVISIVLIRWMSPDQLYRLGFLFLLTGLFLGILFYKFAPATLVTFMLPVVMILIGTGIIFPNAMADALAVTEIPVGISSAMFSGFQMLSAGISSAMMSRFNTSGPLPLILVLAGISLVTLMSYTLPYWWKIRSS